VILSAAWLAGCSTGPRPLEGPVYPSSAARLDPAPIQLRRDGGDVVFTNTTAREFRDVRLWLNAWYAAPIDRLDVGETRRIAITDFRDEHGETMRGGGFFAADPPEPIVLAQLETSEGLVGLVVVGEQTN